MPRRAATKQTINAPLQKGRKATQRERIIAGMVAGANSSGYEGASVSVVIGQAGVSRPTFYEYFDDRDDCFVATISDIQDRVLARIRASIAESAPEESLTAAIRAIVSFAHTEPRNARFLMKESLAGGPRALDARDEGVAQAAVLVEDELSSVPPKTPIPDVPVPVVLGAIHRLLATRLRRGERLLDELLEELEAWIASYRRPAEECQHRKLELQSLPPPSLSPPVVPLRAPRSLTPGRPRLSVEEVAEHHRQRIMFATSRVVAQRGYAAATITEIARVAGVDAREFYRLFGDKQEAFSAIHEVGFHYLMAATAGAFFAAPTWPERIWEAFRAAGQSVQDNPTVAHVGFVESYAIGPRGIQRVEDSRTAFAIFLQEGYRYEPAATPPPSAVAMEAIMAVIFEVVYSETRANTQENMAGLLPNIVYLCLAPFMGPTAAGDFIGAKLAEAQATRPRAKARRAGANAATRGTSKDRTSK